MNTTRPYNRALLQGDEFDLLEFVKLTRDLPFKKLNPVLNDHLNEVKKELGQIVNDEFNRFIQLYSDIGESGTQEIAALENKLDDLNSKLREISVDVNGDHEDVTDVRNQIMEVRRSEILITKENELIEELEILEELYQANEIGLAVNFFAKLEAELNALSDVLSSSSAYIKRLNGQKEGLMTQLEASTSRSLKSASSSEVLLLASFYIVLGKFDDFVKVFIKSVTAPFCTKNVSQTRLEELLKMSSGKPGLVCFYETIVAFMSSAKDTWIEPLSSVCPKGYVLSLDLIVKPVLEHIMSGLSVIFSPANPDAFQHAYTASVQFLSQIIELFEHDKYSIEQSKAWKSFQKSWQVNIYFQLRFREIAGRIEESLDIQLPLLNFNTSKNPNISLDEIYQFKILKAVVRDIWGDSVIIKPLVTKFFKLNLQTCARYVDWLVSIPAEFEGTELGLSTAIIKAYQLHHLRELVNSVLTTSIIPFVNQLGLSPDVFASSIETFLSTKWTDAHLFLNKTVETFWCIYLDRFYHAQFKGAYASSNPMLDNVVHTLKFVDRPVLEASLLKIVMNFSAIGKAFFEASNKSYLNLKRLETVMKAEMSPEDKRKLAEHEKLKSFLTSESSFLSGLLKANGLTCNELDSLTESLL